MHGEDLVRDLFEGAPALLPRAALDLLLAAWPVWALLGGLALLKLAVALYRRRRLARSGIREIDRMDGLTFERYLEGVFSRLGFRVVRTRDHGDYGADLILSRDGERTVVQAKRSRGKVGIKAVQEAVAARAYYGCTRSTVVTNSFFTRQAVELAEANEVELWDRELLVEMLLTARKRRSLPSSQALRAKEGPEERRPSSRPGCAVCGRPVSGRLKQFCRSKSERFRGRLFCAEHLPLARGDAF